MDHPELAVVGPITHEQDPSAVRCITWHQVPARPSDQEGRWAAGYRDGVEITEQVEDYLPSVRGDVEAHGRALVRREGHGAAWAARSLGVEARAGSEQPHQHGAEESSPLRSGTPHRRSLLWVA